MSYKIVLFDKDGTLLRFESVWVKIGHQIIDKFIAHFQIEMPKTSLLEQLGLGEHHIDPSGILSSGTTNDIIEVFSDYSDDPGLSEWTRHEMDMLAHKYEDDLEMIEGTDVVLKHLKAQGYILAVVTADDYVSTDNFLKKFDIRNYFDIILTSDRTPVQKPDKMILQAIFEQYDVQPSEIIMVGDTPIDMQLGKNAKLGMTIGVLSGTSKHEHLNDADIIIQDVTDLIQDGNIIWEGGTSIA